jgi:hypothetical protein
LLSKASATQQARNLKANQFDSLKRQKIDHVQIHPRANKGTNQNIKKATPTIMAMA